MLINFNSDGEYIARIKDEVVCISAICKKVEPLLGMHPFTYIKYLIMDTGVNVPKNVPKMWLYVNIYDWI